MVTEPVASGTAFGVKVRKFSLQRAAMLDRDRPFSLTLARGGSS